MEIFFLGHVPKDAFARKPELFLIHELTLLDIGDRIIRLAEMFFHLVIYCLFRFLETSSRIILVANRRWRYRQENFF